MDPKVAEKIEGTELLVGQNIGGAHAPVPPCSYAPVILYSIWNYNTLMHHE